MEEIKERIEKHYIKGLFCLVALFFIFLLYFIGQFFFDTEATKEVIDNSLMVEETIATSSEKIAEKKEEMGYVDIKGAVNKVGMYAFTENMRVIDIVELAGGFLPEADQEQVNFSQKVTDQMVIYIPRIGEERSTIDSISKNISVEKDEAMQQEEEKININTADVTRLQQLNGIGAKKAQGIIDYREENGSFQSLEDLKKVKGIGEKTFESLKNSITI